jgi:hypothetical protein
MTASPSRPVVLIEHDASGDICTFHTDLHAACCAARHLRVRRHSAGRAPVVVTIRPAVTCLGEEPTTR